MVLKTRYEKEKGERGKEQGRQGQGREGAESAGGISRIMKTKVQEQSKTNWLLSPSHARTRARKASSGKKASAEWRKQSVIRPDVGASQEQGQAYHSTRWHAHLRGAGM